MMDREIEMSSDRFEKHLLELKERGYKIYKMFDLHQLGRG